MKFMHNLVIIYILLLWGALSAQANEEINLWLNKLDQSLDQKEKYDALKMERIKSLEILLRSSKRLETRLETYRQLYEECKSVKYDSAVVYANQWLKIAQQINDANAIAQAKCAVAFCQISAGIMMEAYQQLNGIHPTSLKRETLLQYYEVMAKFWRENADFVHENPYYDNYIARSNKYMDSLLLILPPNSAKWYAIQGSLAMRKRQYKEAISFFKSASKFPNRNKHDQAQDDAEVAWAYHYLGNKEQELIYLIRSAINDNETATREITALYLIALRIDKDGNHDRASRYLTLALNKVQSYNSRQRKMEISAIIPIIEQGRYNAMRQQRNWFIMLGVLIFIMAIGLSIEFLLIRKKNKGLNSAMKTIEKHTEELRQANIQLHNTNEQLCEANKIKDIYIGKSFFITSEFIAKLEHIFRTIDRNMVTKQYDVVRKCVNQDALSQERGNMYEAFDASFLSLFPNFVEKYNELFDSSMRQVPKPHKLTSEMRIFALIRLGITDSERIAKFLDYSVHTVNTYKTRIKNRSLIDNNLFEQKIMEIS